MASRASDLLDNLTSVSYDNLAEFLGGDAGGKLTEVWLLLAIRRL
jgi:hypothetical protein